MLPIRQVYEPISIGLVGNLSDRSGASHVRSGLPIVFDRVSWKLILSQYPGSQVVLRLPIVFDRVSWKHCAVSKETDRCCASLPIVFDRVSWKLNTLFGRCICICLSCLPIVFDRVSWKQNCGCERPKRKEVYRLFSIGLVGNFTLKLKCACTTRFTDCFRSG